MSYQMSEEPKPGMFSTLLGGGRTFFLVALVLAVVAAGLSFVTLSAAAGKRETYLVLGQDVPERSPVTSGIVVEKTGDAPPNALTVADLDTGLFFAKIPLQAGDVVTDTIVGEQSRVDADLPPNYVVASVSVEPENAVGGKIRTGDNIDVYAIAESEGAGESVTRLVMQNVKVLDVTVSPQTIQQNDVSGEDPSSQPGPEAAQLRGGIPSIYTLAVPREAAKVLSLSLTGVQLWLTLSPEEIVTGPAEDSYGPAQLLTAPFDLEDLDPEKQPAVPGEASPSASPEPEPSPVSPEPLPVVP